MSHSKNDKPPVATFADYEIITPPNKLRRTLSTVPDDDLDDPVARAEAALADLSSEFASWMEAECLRLDAARVVVKAEGFTKATREVLFHAAHDIKGEAATFGYPLVTGAAASLCRLVEHTSDMARIPLTLIDQHVDAICAMVRESARPHSATIAEALTQRLREVTDDFLAQEGRERPDNLDDILGPALAPTDHTT